MEKTNNKNQAMGTQNSCPPSFNQKKNKKGNSATVVSAAAGIGGGVAVGVGAAALWPNSADASEIDENDFINKAEAPQGDHTEQSTVVEHVNVHHGADVHHSAEVHHATPAHIEQPVEPNVEPHVDPNQPEVVNYTHVVDESGNQLADVAQVRYGNEEIHYFDTDMNNEANVAWYDANHNLAMEEDEVVDVRDAHIKMSNFQEVSQHTDVHVFTNEEVQTYNEIQDPGMDYTTEAGSDIAMNDDMPDYVNDADVDSFIG